MNIKRNNNPTKEKGIQISKGYENNSLQENKILMWFVRVLVIFMGTFGALYSFVSGYELDYTIEFFITISLICAVLFGTLYGIKKIAVWVLPALILFLIIIGYVNNNQLYSFLAYTWNDCVKFLSSINFKFPEFSTLGVQIFNETFMWLFVSLAFSAIIGFFSFCKIHFLPVFIITFVPLEIVIYFGLVPDFFSVICLFACNAAVLSMSVIKLKRKYFENYNYPHRGLAVISLIMCIFFAAAMCLSNWSIAIWGYERPEEFDILRKNFATFSIEDLMSEKKETVDLSNQGKRETDSEEDLLIKAPMESNSVYIKCRTGSEYLDNKWYDFKSSVYNEPPVNSMSSKNISVSDIFAASDKDKKSLGLMTIKSVFDMSGLTYLPYGFYNNGNYTAIFDEGAIRNNNKSLEYSVSYDRLVNNFWGELQDDPYFYRESQYSEISQEYTDFVNDHYTQIPDNLTKLKQTADELVAEEFQNESFSRREYIIKSVRAVQNYLKKNTEYSLEPGAVPDGEDFTEHFLFENKKGFCVHYATAGVMLLRAMGIPCRYATGYIITKENFDNAEDVSSENVIVPYLENQKIINKTIKQKTATLSITDENAHAWAEVYVEGLGWFPCEMTSGYSQSNSGLGDLSYDETEQESESEATVSETDETTEIVTETTEPATETQTENSEIFSDLSNDSDNKSDSSGIDFYVLLIIFGVIVLLVAVDLTLRAIIVKKRLRSFKGNNLNQNAKNLYLYLEKILLYAKFKDLEKENLTIGFDKIFRRFDFVDNKKCSDTVKVLQKLFYGNSRISAEELRIVEEFVLSFVNNFISRQKRFKRFVYKYILFLF